jgi:hypothetical protein
MASSLSHSCCPISNSQWCDDWLSTWKFHFHSTVSDHGLDENAVKTDDLHSRFSTMSWLAIGTVIGLFVTRWEEKPREALTPKMRLRDMWTKISLLILLGPFVACAFYVIVQEIKDFGTCKTPD